MTPPPPELLLAELEQMTPALKRLLRGLLEDPTRADDVLQEARVRVWSHPPAHATNVGGWLRVVVGNLARRARREDARRRRREHVAARPDRVPPSESDLERRERIAVLLAAIEELAEPERTTLIERYLEGLTAEGIASRHRISRATVDRRLVRARARLRALAERPRERRWAWIPFLPWGGRDSALGIAAGGLVVSAKTVVLVVVVAAIGYASGWFVRGQVDGTPPRASEEVSAPPSLFGDPRADASLRGKKPTDDATLEDQVARDPRADEATHGPTKDQALSADAWLGLVNGAEDDRAAYRVIERLVRLGPVVSRDVLVQILARIEPPSRQRACVEPLCELGKEIHPYAVDLLRVLGRAPTLKSQNAALAWVNDIAWTDWSEDIGAFDAWCAGHAGVTTEEVLARSVRDWVSRTEHADRKTLEAMLGERRAGLVKRAKRTANIDLLPLARETGLEALVGGWWRDLTLSSGAREHALDWAILLATEGEAAGDELLLDDLRAVLHDPSEQPSWLITRAAGALAARDGEGTLDLLLNAYERVPRVMDWWNLSTNVARLGNARAIPYLIAVIEAHDAYESVYGIGYFGLSKLTGVPYDEAHDGPWWRAWWQKNRQRFASEVAALDIPSVTPVAR